MRVDTVVVKVVKVDSVVNKADTTMVARLATLAVALATWRKIAARDRNATTVVAWDTSAATVTKPLRPRSAIGANNPDTSPVIVPTSPLKPARCSARHEDSLRAIVLALNFLLKIVLYQFAAHRKHKKMVLLISLSLYSLSRLCVWYLVISRYFFYLCMFKGTGNGVVAGGTGCAGIYSIDLGGFRVARRFAECACVLKCTFL